MAAFSIKKTSHPRIFSPEVTEKITKLHCQGYSLDEICDDVGIKKNTLTKAISQKRVVLTALEDDIVDQPPTTKSIRSVSDNMFGMGKSCSNELSRVLSSRGGGSAATSFGNHVDLNYGGLLLAIPSLLSCGLLRHISLFESVSGYYSATHVFICLSFLSLLRINKLEQAEGVPCGELGRCMGLDRIPEVKTLRKRIARFCQATDVSEWSSLMSRDWLDADKNLAGALYIDGHVSLYYGRQTQMPKRFVSRMRLCMSGSTDYWVNNQLGEPFFVVHKTINEGMIKVLENDIVPRLIIEVPNQPSADELLRNDKLHRFMLVFDREGYSIDFFAELARQRIAFCTYRKNVKENWPEEEFEDVEIITQYGEKEIIQLAERQTVLKGKKEKEQTPKEVTVREIRKKSASGHQTSIVTNNFLLSSIKIAVLMFSRWCQENFFKYMVESFGIDSITSYHKDFIPDTSSVVNPEYRELDRQHKSIISLLNKSKQKYAEISLQGKELSGKKLEQYIKKKSEKLLEIEDLEKKRTAVIEKKKTVDKKIPFRDLDESQQFSSSVNERKIFFDMIKIISYRAETALCNIIKKKMASPDEARSLIRKLYSSDADIEIDEINKRLTVKLHLTNHWADDKILKYLCEKLNETETVFPDTHWTCCFKLVSS